ncbi:hypothetical protein DPSP01_012373 [Paraphaeosphaeria sporulosa]
MFIFRPEKRIVNPRNSRIASNALKFDVNVGLIPVSGTRTHLRHLTCGTASALRCLLSDTDNLSQHQSLPVWKACSAYLSFNATLFVFQKAVLRLLLLASINRLAACCRG